ncbi:MAG: F0F1 ATP synthase subunit beta, partial [bacterium]
MAKGKVVQIIGSTLDAEFPPGSLPAIFNALKIDLTVEGRKSTILAEVQQHIGAGQVRAVALSSTDGIARGIDVEDTGEPIRVPVGEKT